MISLTLTGHHPTLSHGDVKRLIQEVLDSSALESAAQDTVDARIVPGGYSGSVVILVWVPDIDPFIVKCGPDSEIVLEHETRQIMAGNDTWLRRRRLDGVYGPIQVEVGEATAGWRAVCYRYVGSRTYRELESFGDFASFLANFVVATDPDFTPSVNSIRACLRYVAQALTDEAPVSQETTGRALAHFLPKIRWDRGIEAGLTVASALWPDVEELKDFHAWYESASQAILVAPVADRRRIHGDARLANFLVDSVHASVHLIDFGNGREGHVFEDLCRFELDLILSTAPRHPGSYQLVQDDAVLTFSMALLDDFGLQDREIGPDDKHAKCLKLWRNELASVLQGWTLHGAPMMYRWFLLVECLRRLRWVGQNGEANAGVDAPTLLRFICALRKRLQTQQIEVPIATPPDALRALNCVASYVPMAGREHSINEKRNLVKRRALANARRKAATVRVLAETGYSYLSSRGALHSDVRELLAASGSLQIVICNPFFLEAKGISFSYAAPRPWAEHPPAAFNRDLKRKFDSALHGYEILREEFQSLIELRFAHFGIASTTLMTDDSYFFEPYFRAERGRREKVLFDSFELQFNSTSQHMKTLLEETFDFHWRNSDRVGELAELEQQCQTKLELILRMWQTVS